MELTILPSISQMTEKPSLYEPTQQINNTNPVNYGATGHVANNPFASSMVEEPVQPEAKDVYMHGTSDDRSY